MSQGSPAHQVHACAAALDLEDARGVLRGGATRPAAARLREAQNVEPGPAPDRPTCATAACRGRPRRRLHRRRAFGEPDHDADEREQEDQPRARRHLRRVFRRKPNTDSAPSRTLVPLQAEHRFRSKPNTDSAGRPSILRALQRNRWAAVGRGAGRRVARLTSTGSRRGGRESSACRWLCGRCQSSEA